MPPKYKYLPIKCRRCKTKLRIISTNVPKEDWDEHFFCDDCDEHYGKIHRRIGELVVELLDLLIDARTTRR